MAETEEKTKSRRNAFTNAFKLEACKLSKEVGNRAAARQLGLSEKNIRRWLGQKELVHQDMSKKANRGMKPKWPGLERDLRQWILDKNPITAAEVKLRAMEIAEEKQIEDFKASKGWLVKFMRRMGLPYQCDQTLPESWLDQVKSFRSYVAAKKLHGNVMQENFVNVDEVPCTFDVPKCQTTAADHEHGYENIKFTVVLGVSAAGEKLNPMVIFKSETARKEAFSPNILVSVNESGWTNAGLMRNWMDNVWSSRGNSLPTKSECLIVFDACAAHVTEEFKAAVEPFAELALIPAGLARYLQPLDISVNKAFKRHIERQCEEWTRNKLSNCGNQGKSTFGVVCGWIVEAWCGITTDCIKEGFLKAGIESYENFILPTDEDECMADEVESDDADPLVGDTFNGWEETPLCPDNGFCETSVCTSSDEV